MIVASRGRPLAASETAEAIADTATGDTRVVVLCDADDPELGGYEALALPARTHVVRWAGPQQRLGPVLSAAAVQLARHCDFVGFMGDDSRPRTSGWDEELTGALTAPGVAYGDDLYAGERLPTAPVITARVITALGYMCPPGIAHLYLDDFWYRLGEDLGNRCYLPDVVIEHLHPVAGKSAWDDGYRERNSAGQYSADQSAFAQFLASRWPADLARLKESL